MLQILFTSWVTILPLVFWDGRYEGPKVLWFLIGGVGIILFWIYRILVKKINIKLTKPDAFYFFWLLILLISSFLGIHPLESIIGGSYRHQGVIFFLLLWLVGKTSSILKKKDKKYFNTAIAIGILTEGLVVIGQYVFGKLYFGKPLGTIGEANAAAGFLAIGSYFIYQSFPKIILLIPLVSLLLTQSRSGILAGLMVFGNLIHFTKPKLKIIIWSLVIFIAAILVMFLTSQKINSPFENRLTVWKLGINSVMQKPVLGYGAESGELVYNKAFKNYGLPLYNLMVDRSHNLFIDVAMWSGILGLIFFSMWLFERFKYLDSVSKKYALAAFLVYSFFQPLSIVHWILFFLIV